MKVVITIVNICMMVVSHLRELNLEIVTNIFHGNKRLNGYSKDVTLDYVLTMSQCLFAKPLNFLIDIVNGF